MLTYFDLQPPPTTAGINRPYAGARTEGDLPVGKHALQLYSLATPNGVKVTCALEELGVPYDAWPVNILKGEQFTSGFVAANPNSKIPVLVDNSGPAGVPANVFESGHILLYLAEKYGKLIPTDPAARTECLNWLFCNVRHLVGSLHCWRLI
jgi:GST-like protein